MWNNRLVTNVAGAPPLHHATAPVHPVARRGHTAGQSSVTLAGLGLGLIVLRTVGVHAPPCPFRAITGVPCPGCGMTRLADALAHGRVQLALHADPAGVALLAAISVLATVHLVRVVRRGRPPAAWMGSWAVPAAIVALVALHWTANLLGGGFASS